MIHYSTQTMPPMFGYKFLSGAVIPRPIAWISTVSNDGQKTNAAPFSFFNVVAPNLVSVSILGGPYGRKDTSRNILETESAVIHLINIDNIKEMNQTAASFPPEMSEIEAFDLSSSVSETSPAPSLENAPIRLEVKLHQHIPIEQNGYLVSDLFILEVTDYFFKEEIFDEAHAYIIPEKFQPIARLAGNTYATLGDLFDVERPQ
ncbi:MAG: flavin reductase family protein [Streptococcaceae bacterium]|jgi:flavin reductase (DIM6/NTAB) family NADH-FMN oxidoreductase RutF|nr:flavin reductase family protein [Streptococcaceae bacterium]